MNLFRFLVLRATWPRAAVAQHRGLRQQIDVLPKRGLPNLLTQSTLSY